MRDTSEEKTTKAKYVYWPELDALRFFAFLAVFLRHTTPDRAVWYEAKLHLSNRLSETLATISLTGPFGVYLFFALSSYLITNLLLREKSEFGKVHVKEFYFRRLLRIWPLYFLILGLGAAASVIIKPFDRGSLPFFIFMAGNWAAITSGVISRTIMHLWSISVEEQFYFLWPPLVSRVGLKGMQAMAGIFLVLPIPAILLGPNSFLYASQNSFSAFSAMAVGILLASVVQGEMPKIRVPRWIYWGVAYLLWFVAASMHIGDTKAASLSGLLIVNVGCLLFLLGSSGWKPADWLVRLGRISYGLYMYHMLIVLLFEHFLGRTTISPKLYPFEILGELGLTVVMALVSYRFLETPFLRLKERYTFVRSRPI